MLRRNAWRMLTKSSMVNVPFFLLHPLRLGGRMKRLERIFPFLVVQDPKQTRVNILLFVLILAWAGFSFIANMVGQYVYYFITLPKFEAQQKSGFLQTLSPDMLPLVGWLLAALALLAGVIKWQVDERAKADVRRELKDSQESRVRDLKETVGDATVMMGGVKSSLDSLTTRIGDAIQHIK